MNKDLVIDFVRNNNLIGIKAGSDRPTFLDIWMVVVEERVFARSWGLAEKSWYNSFLQNPNGQIKCGANIFPIKAIIPIDKDTMAEKINFAYLTKYNTAHNLKYAQGIVQQKHIDKTMEIIMQED